jgi:adenosine/AMP kinase
MSLLKDFDGLATIVLLKAHLQRRKLVRWTGRDRDANKLAHIKPLFVSFVCAHLDYMREAYGYKMRRGAKEPGQKAQIFAAFRDVWLPRALREMRAEVEDVAVEEVEETTYLHKRNQALTKREPCITGVVGWELSSGEA